MWLVTDMGERTGRAQTPAASAEIRLAASHKPTSGSGLPEEVSQDCCSNINRSSCPAECRVDSVVAQGYQRGRGPAKMGKWAPRKGSR